MRRVELKLEGVSKTYPARGGAVQALEDINLEIAEGELVCVVGQSGCGKSTLLQIAAGLEPPTTGRVYAGGQLVTGPDRRRGMVFQGFSLFPWLDVTGNVAFGLKVQGVRNWPEQVERILRLVGLEGFQQARPHHLSGGMAQRVALARTLVNEPPLCRFGLQGTCCRRCLWGPCRVTAKKRGVCGADVPLVVISNHIRMVAAGCAAHGQHARLRLEAILAIAEGRMAGELRGPERVWWLAGRFGLLAEGRSLNKVAADVARYLLADLSRVEREPMKALLALAPAERVALWRELDVLPTSAFSEVFETLQRTSLGTDSDWRNVVRQELRLSLAFFWGCVVAASWASEMLYGPPRRQAVRVGFGTLAQGNTVKVAVHGHAPVLAEALVIATQRPDLIQEARAAGAEGIDLYGICCTGQELLARHGIPTISGILGQELVIGTGALDALVADQQCVIPGVGQVAACFGTAVITTSDSARMEGAIHIPLDLEHIEDVAENILRAAIAAYGRRRERPRHVPALSQTAQVGWDDRSILAAFGGRAEMLRLIREGEIKGIATLVSCNTPKVPYEYSNVALARDLLRRNVLITTTGCASHALLNAGLADPSAADLAGERLARACRRAGVPPVLPVGACVDNTRTMFLFLALAEEARLALPQMPFFYVGAEPGNEKALGMGMAFFAHGISVLAGYPVPVPVPLPVHVEGGDIDDYVRPRNEIADFFGDEARQVVGAKIYSEPDPDLAAGAIDMEFRRKRLALGWG